MSVCNLILTPNSVQAITDTLAVHPDGTPGAYMRKITVNSRVRLAVTGRGRVGHLQPINEAVMRAEARQGAEAAILAYLPTVDFAGLPEHKAVLEVTLIGYDGGAFATRFTAGADGVRRYDLAPGTYLAPAIGRHDLPGAVTVEQLAKLSEVQQHVAKKHGILAGIGGDMELTVITAAGATTTVVGEYPDKALTTRRMETPAEDGAEPARLAS